MKEIKCRKCGVVEIQPINRILPINWMGEYDFGTGRHSALCPQCKPKIKK